MLESLFDKVAGIQAVARLIFYFSLGIILKNLNELSIDYVLLKNVKCKAMFMMEYL